MRNTWLGLAVLVAACGGSDNNALDGGSDGTTSDVSSDSPGQDASNKDAATDAGQDGSVDEAGTDATMDAPDDVSLPFACGPKVCAPSDYCLISHGLVSLDGGTTTTYACTAMPNKCFPTPACTCVKPVGACTCTDNGGELTYDCSF